MAKKTKLLKQSHSREGQKGKNSSFQTSTICVFYQPESNTFFLRKVKGYRLIEMLKDSKRFELE